MTFTITALGAVRSGQCTAVCLIAGEEPCECRCGGAFHGALADTEVTPTPPPPDTCGAQPPAQRGGFSTPPSVRCELDTGHPPVYIHHHGGYGSWTTPADDAARGGP